MAVANPPIVADPAVILRIRESSGKFRKSTIWVERDNFYGHSKHDKSNAHIIVGFDT